MGPNCLQRLSSGLPASKRALYRITETLLNSPVICNLSPQPLSRAEDSMANVLCFCYCIVSIMREKCSHTSVIQSNLVKRLMEAVGGGGGGVRAG